jgi:putative SOS response-associated peptidase YedK
MPRKYATPALAEIEKVVSLSPAPRAFKARYNVCPGSLVPVLRSTSESEKISLIEVRLCDEATANPLSAGAASEERCLMPVLGWYEWATDADVSGPQAYFIHLRDESIVCLAGSLSHQEGELVFRLFPGRVTSSIDGQPTPAIVSPSNFAEWINKDEGTLDACAERVEGLTARAVGKRINDSASEGPELVSPIPVWPHPPTGTRDVRQRDQVPANVPA